LGPAIPISIGKQESMVYFTLKETAGGGHKIYSLELKEIKNRTQGGTPQERTTSGHTPLSPDSSEKSSGLPNSQTRVPA
jgi:hypothetical protein